MDIREGTFEFKGYKTWYRIVGQCTENRKPLLLLHGGPGSSHNYFQILDSLAQDGRMIIMYDQLGCGNSPAEGRTDLFNLETWLEQLKNLCRHLELNQVHMLGHSWGGMLLLEYLCSGNQENICSAVLSSTLPSSELWGREQHRMVEFLPPDMRDAIHKADETGCYDSPECLRATEEYMLRHCSPVWPDTAPECLKRRNANGREAYVTAWGPNEFTPMGNLRTFDRTADLSQIHVPVLVTSGTNDLCTPLIAKTMADSIPNAVWKLFAHSRHMPFAEEYEAYTAILKDWLRAHD